MTFRRCRRFSPALSSLRRPSCSPPQTCARSGKHGHRRRTAHPVVNRRGGASRGHRRAGGKPAVQLLPLPHSSVLSCAVSLYPAQGTVRSGFLITRKPRRVCRPQAAKNSRAIFSLDMCVKENTSQSASVEFVRHRRANYARSRLQAFCRKKHRFFRQSQKNEPSQAHFLYLYAIIYAFMLPSALNSGSFAR